MNIGKNFTLRLQDQVKEPFSPKLREAVDELWRTGKKPLFDGEIFQVLTRSEEGLGGRFIPYRYFYATHVQPALFAKEPIVVAAVTGVTHADGKYLLGKRAEDVTQDPLKWEFAPSGGISSDYLQEDETVDFELQILKELEEEVGIDLGSKKNLLPFLVIEGPVVEICVWIDVSDVEIDLGDEYREFDWLSLEQIENFVAQHEVTPVTREIIKHLE